MASSPPKPAATILVVDDDREVLSLAVDLLRSGGYTVLGTTVPSQALQLARNHAEPLDLLLTDVVMPLKNGLQLRIGECGLRSRRFEIEGAYPV